MTKDKHTIRMTFKGYYYSIQGRKVLRGRKRRIKIQQGGYYNAKSEKWQMKYRNYFELGIWNNPLY